MSENAFIKAIDTIVDARLQKLRFDKTIQAEIVSIIDLVTREYKVQYESGIFSAFANNTEEVYSIGDNVYVKIPENDYSKRKTIEGLVQRNALAGTVVVEQYNGIGPDLHVLYNYDVSPVDPNKWSVIAGATAGGDAIHSSYQIFSTSGNSSADTQFQLYANYNNKLRIRAEFQTLFNGIFETGNYGLQVIFETLDASGVSHLEECILDLTSFSGSPYEYLNFSTQEAIFNLNGSSLVGLRNITLFEDFSEYDTWQEPQKNGDIYELVTKSNSTEANIFVQNIQIQFVEEVDYSNDYYNLTILSPSGLMLGGGTSSLDLEGLLLYAGAELTSNVTYQWFIQDASVIASSDNYNSNAGTGWKYLSDGKTLTLTINDIIFQNKYKLLAIYKDSEIFSKEIIVYKYNSSYDGLTINQVTEGDNILLSISNSSLKGDWYVLLDNGSYRKVTNGENTNSISINDYLVLYPSMIFYCQIPNIGCLEKIILTAQSADNLNVIFTGETAYHYNANGDISYVGDIEKTHVLSAKIQWEDGFASQYTLKWFIGEQEIGSSSFNPSESMLRNVSLQNNQEVHYKIQRTFNNNYKNNTIRVQINTIDGNSYEFEKELQFSKDGDQGTNGTEYLVVISPYHTSVQESNLDKYPILYYNNNSWDTIYLNTVIYKNGQIVNETGSGYTITYNWSATNCSVTTDSRPAAAITANSSTLGANYRVVRLEAIIKDPEGETTTVYYHYPIDVLVGSGLDKQLLDLELISEIQYSASGYNPTYKSGSLSVVYNGTDYSNNIEAMSLSGNQPFSVIDVDGAKKLRPITHFVDSISLNSLKCNLQDSNHYLLHTVMMYLNTYGNEALNSWDGTSLRLKDGEYILAPQIGAGVKNSDNTFTGITMGQWSGMPSTKSGSNVGLFGFNNGVGTFRIDSQGNAFFGRNDEISLLGTGAGTITGKNAASTYYMDLNLVASNTSTKAIAVGQRSDYNFYVTYGGILHAKQANISGTLTAGAGSKIGGWNIGSNAIYSGDTYLWNDGSIDLGSNFSVDSNGNLTASNVDISGTIDATGGSIGGWNLTSTTIQTPDKSVILKNDGTLTLGKNFSVDSNGNLSLTDASFYATDNNNLYVKITSQGLAVYDKTVLNYINNPKIRMYAFPYDGTSQPEIILGAGSGLNNMDNVFQIRKTNVATQILHWNSDGTSVGFRLNGANASNPNVIQVRSNMTFLSGTTVNFTGVNVAGLYAQFAP